MAAHWRFHAAAAARAAWLQIARVALVAVEDEKEEDERSGAETD